MLNLPLDVAHQYEDGNKILVTDCMIKKNKKAFSSTQINHFALEYTPKMERFHKEIPVNGVHWQENLLFYAGHDQFLEAILVNNQSMKTNEKSTQQKRGQQSRKQHYFSSSLAI